MKALVVEDEFVNRHFLQGVLSGYGRCDVALGGDEALEAVAGGWAANDPYDLICLDVVMPGRDGCEVLREIRRREKELGSRLVSRTKIIMITVLNGPADVLRALAEDCEAYLVKPVAKRKLLETLGRLGLVPSPEIT